MMETNSIRVLARALDVLNYMADRGEPTRVSDIAGGTGLSPATAYRILSTLRERNVVLQGENALYMIGPTPLLWAGAYRSRLALSQAFHDHVGELCEMSRETIHLFSFERDCVYYIDKVDSPQVVIMRSRIGACRDLYSTGGGRAVLGALPEEERRAYLDRTELKPHTPETRTDKETLLRLLDEGNRRGWQEEINENEVGIRCIGAPVLDGTGRPTGAVSVSAPSYRMDDAISDRIGSVLRATVDRMTAALAKK